LGDIEFGGLAH
jgi:hypothetical protein